VRKETIFPPPLPPDQHWIKAAAKAAETAHGCEENRRSETKKDIVVFVFAARGEERGLREGAAFAVREATAAE